MKMKSGPVQFTPLTATCQGTNDSCGTVMEEIELKDLRHIHHPAMDQRDVASDEVFIHCMGCNKKIHIKGVHPYHLSLIKKETNSHSQWDR